MVCWPNATIASPSSEVYALDSISPTITVVNSRLHLSLYGTGNNTRTAITNMEVRSGPMITEFRTAITMDIVKVNTKDAKTTRGTDVRALQHATHCYRSWMGSIEAFQDAIGGIPPRLRRGYDTTNRGWRDRDSHDGYRWGRFAVCLTTNSTNSA